MMNIDRDTTPVTQSRQLDSEIFIVTIKAHFLRNQSKLVLTLFFPFLSLSPAEIKDYLYCTGASHAKELESQSSSQDRLLQYRRTVIEHSVAEQ